MQYNKLIVLPLMVFIWSGTAYGYSRGPTNNTSYYSPSTSYNDDVILPRMNVLNSIRPTLPSTIMVSGTAFPERTVDQVTKDIDLTPFTLDKLVYQVYVPLSQMQGTPDSAVLSFKTNQKFSRAYQMNFGASSWSDAAGNFGRQHSIFNYRYDGVQVYGQLTDKKESLDDIWYKYGTDTETVDTSLGYQNEMFNFVNNGDGIPDPDLLEKGTTYPIVDLKPLIHPYLPSQVVWGSGAYARSEAPLFRLTVKPEDRMNAPYLFTGRFQLRTRNASTNISRDPSFVARPEKYLRILFFMRGGMRFTNPATRVSSVSPLNVIMNRKIASQCRAMAENAFPPVGFEDDVNGLKFTDEVYQSVLSPAGIKKSDMKNCNPIRHEIYPLTYTLFVS